MHTSVTEIDPDLLVSGDQATVRAAKAIYRELARLAPANLADEWAVIIRDVETMIDEAAGRAPTQTVDASAFRSAYSTIHDDYLRACVEASASASPG
jgi:hypothetical protein